MSSVRAGCRRHSRSFRTATSGAPDGFDATFQIRLGDVGRTWEVAHRGDALRGPPLADPRARRRHRHRRLDLARAARGPRSPASTPSRSAASTPAATSTWRSASRASSDLPGGRAPLLRIDEVETGARRGSRP